MYQYSEQVCNITVQGLEYGTARDGLRRLVLISLSKVDSGWRLEGHIFFSSFAYFSCKRRTLQCTRELQAPDSFQLCTLRERAERATK